MFFFFFLCLFNLVFFCLSFFGILLSRRNIILIIMCLELVILSINFNFVLFSLYLDDLLGQVCCLFILLVAAAESALGLALFVSFNRYHHKSINYFFY